MNVGCVEAAVTFTNSATFATQMNLKVGDQLANVYTISEPKSSLKYCRILSHQVVRPDGSAWVGESKLSVSGASLSLLQSSLPDAFSFRIKTTWTGILTSLSPTVRASIICASTYSITAGDTAPSQYQSHSNTSSAFVLPTYTSSQQAGCPASTVQAWSEKSCTSGTAIDSLSVSGSLVKPTDPSKHKVYEFYTRVSTAGGSCAAFGPYKLYIGCFLGTDPSFSVTEAPDFISSLALHVGDSPDKVYRLIPPTSNRPWC